MSNLNSLYNEGFLSGQRTIKSVGGLLILAIPYILTRKTGKAIFMKWMPFLYVLFRASMDNYILFYALSEEG